MVNRSTVVGLLALALVGAGVFWARSRPPSLPAGHLPAATAGQAPRSSAAAEAADDESLPGATLADATVTAGDVRITLSLSPQPPVAFAKFRVRVSAFALAPPAPASAKATADERLVIEGGRVVFEMTMPMGDHRYSLVPGAEGWQEAEVVLPLCQSGKRRWYATVEGTIAGRPVTARFRLDLAPPVV
jgi:hypothetical protein